MISHNLADVFEVADRVIVLRLGRRVGSFEIATTTSEQIVAAITGAEFGGIDGARARRDGRPREGSEMSAMSTETVDSRATADTARHPAGSTARRGVNAAAARRPRADSRRSSPLSIIAVYFQIATSGDFLRSRNLTEMIGEIITIGTLALGAVLVLLIREIDLSLGGVSGLGAAAMAVLSYATACPWPVAIAAGLLVGALVRRDQRLLHLRRARAGLHRHAGGV